MIFISFRLQSSQRMNHSKKDDTISIINATAYIAALVFSFIGLVANAVIFYILLTEKRLHKSAYYLVRVSVISDIISNTTSVFAYLIAATIEIDFNLGNQICKISVFIILSSYGISVLTLCVISFDRFMSIVKSFSSFYRIYKSRVLILLEVAICFIAVIIAMPALFLATVYLDNVQFCDIPSVTTSVAAYFITAAAVFYIFPAIVLLACYGRIIIFMRSHVQPGESFQEQLHQQKLQRKKCIKAFITIAAVSLLTTWPFWITSVSLAITQKSLRDISQNNNYLYALAFLSFASTSWISIVNPFLYLRFDGNIRQKLMAIIQKFSLYA